jgi:predicted MPP superfamily phosphohydrolase
VTFQRLQPTDAFSAVVEFYPGERVKLRSGGRGTGYSVWRGVVESALGILYVGDWPARLWARVPGACSVAVEKHVIQLPGGVGAGCRLAFVSDLHLGPTTPRQVLEAAFALVRRARPDLLVLGGDYVYLDAGPSRLFALAALVRSVECQVKVAVLGNHDLWTDDVAIEDALSEVGVSVLVNQGVRLPRPWADVGLVGLDDPWAGRCDARLPFAALDGCAFRIVVCHSPDGLLHLSDVAFNLFLAGHTHGGHMAAPWGPIVLSHGQLCGRYPAGESAFNGARVLVSRGVGGIEVPVRTYARPDILLVELERRTGVPS